MCREREAGKNPYPLTEYINRLCTRQKKNPLLSCARESKNGFSLCNTLKKST